MIALTVKVSGKPPALSAAEWREALKVGWRAVGQFWHRKILGKHFTEAGAREYRYQPRTPEYLRKKERLFGHRRPLVFSGRLMAEVMQTEDVRYTSKGVGIVLHGPSYTTIRWAARGQPRKSEELRKISAGDRKRIIEVLEQVLTAEMNRRQNAGGGISLTAGHRRAA